MTTKKPNTTKKPSKKLLVAVPVFLTATVLAGCSGVAVTSDNGSATDSASAALVTSDATQTAAQIGRAHV